jgi:hypothetical protein
MIAVCVSQDRKVHMVRHPRETPKAARRRMDVRGMKKGLYLFLVLAPGDGGYETKEAHCQTCFRSRGNPVDGCPQDREVLNEAAISEKGALKALARAMQEIYSTRGTWVSGFHYSLTVFPNVQSSPKTFFPH